MSLPNKKQTMYADDILPDDYPVGEMPREAPTANSALAKGKSMGQGLPTAKVSSGEVAIHNPSPSIDLANAPDPSEFLSQFGNANTDETEGVEEPVPPVEETLPAIIQTALSTAPGEIKSYQMANIVKQQPPQKRSQLEAAGKEIFSEWSSRDLSLKDIYAITSLTNSETEVKVMLAWIMMHGRKIADDIRYNFPGMPGYKPRAEIWEDEGARFMIVRETPKDFSGVDEDIEATFDNPDFEEMVDSKECLFYIYGWDEPKEKIESPTKMAMIGEAMTMAKAKQLTVREALDVLIHKHLFESDGSRECPACGAFIDEDFEECPECGEYIKYQGACPKCGTEIYGEEDQACPECGFDPFGEVSDEDWDDEDEDEELEESIFHRRHAPTYNQDLICYECETEFPAGTLSVDPDGPPHCPNCGSGEIGPNEPFGVDKYWENKKKIKEGVGSDLEDVSSFEKPSIMQYTAKWQEYQGPLITIRFKARSDEEALKKIFLKKVVKDEGNDTLEEWCEEYEIPITDINQKWLEEYFDDIDISGWPYLDELTNLTRGETVYTSGYESSGDDEDWDDDE